MGGHDEVFRHLVCQRAVHANLTSMANEVQGKQRMYRTREEMEQRWIELGGKPDSSSWFRKGGITGIVNVPSSAKGRIKRKADYILRKMSAPRGQKMRTQERPGPSLKLGLVKNDPKPKIYCGRNNCPLAQNTECKNRCYIESVDYSIACKRCIDRDPTQARVYIGETSKNIYTRLQGHIGDLKRSAKNPRITQSWMANHVSESHGGHITSQTPLKIGSLQSVAHIESQ